MKNREMVPKKIQEELDRTQNSVHLEGPVYSCVITNKEKPSNFTVADLELVTATRHKNEQGKMELVDKMYHRVRILATGEKAEKLINLEKEFEASRNAGTKAKAQVLSLDGEITVGKNGQPYILAKEENVTFSDKISFKNSLTLQGKVEKTVSNNHFATAILSTKTSFDTKVLIPMVVFNKDNPKGWADIASEKVHKGDTINISGPLVSAIYGNGEDSKYRCSVNAKHYTVLNQKLAKERKTGVSM